MSKGWTYILIIALAYFGWNSWSNRAVTVTVPGMIAPEEPVQENLSARSAPEFQINHYTLKAQASYSIKARLLRRENYRYGREADLSPVDFALGWGVMSSNELLNQLSISQSGRFYYLRWQQPLTVPERQVMRSSANTHIIPVDDFVARQIDKMRAGHLVELKGYLVNASASDGWRWNTSMTRNDTGSGACELFLVQSARIIEPL